MRGRVRVMVVVTLAAICLAVWLVCGYFGANAEQNSGENRRDVRTRETGLTLSGGVAGDSIAPPRSQATETLRGMVIDGVTGRAVAGASIHLGRAPTTNTWTAPAGWPAQVQWTDGGGTERLSALTQIPTPVQDTEPETAPAAHSTDSGEFHVTLASGVTALIVRADGYQDAIVGLPKSDGPTVRLTAGRALEGKVVSVSEQPLPRAFRLGCLVVADALLLECKVAPDGTFRTFAPSPVVFFSGSVGWAVEDPLEVPPGGTTTVRVRQLPTLELVALDGAPLPASVTVVCRVKASGVVRVGRALQVVNGLVALPPLFFSETMVREPCTLTVLAPGYEPVEVHLPSLAGAGTVRIAVRAATRPGCRVVVTSRGEASKGTRVKAYLAPGERPGWSADKVTPILTVETNDRGEAALDLPPGPYYVRVLEGDHDLCMPVSVPCGQDLTIDLALAASVCVDVVDQQDQAVVGRAVAVLERTGRVRHARTDTRGRATFVGALPGATSVFLSNGRENGWSAVQAAERGRATDVPAGVKVIVRLIDVEEKWRRLTLASGDPSRLVGVRFRDALAPNADWAALAADNSVWSGRGSVDVDVPNVGRWRIDTRAVQDGVWVIPEGGLQYSVTLTDVAGLPLMDMWVCASPLDEKGKVATRAGVLGVFASTDDGGRCTLRHLEPGPYQFTFESSAVAVKTFVFRPRRVPTQAGEVISVVLPTDSVHATRVVRGRVLSPTGAGLRGIFVSLAATFQQRDGSLIKTDRRGTAVSGNDGHVALVVPDGEAYRVYMLGWDPRGLPAQVTARTQLGDEEVFVYQAAAR